MNILNQKYIIKDIKSESTDPDFISNLRNSIGGILRGDIQAQKGPQEFTANEDISGYTNTINNILEIIDDIRNNTLRTLYLRGTGTRYMDESIGKGKISSKVVTEFYENDIGNVACYKIPTYPNNICNEEFLYRFLMTILGSVRYAFNHSFGNGMSLILFGPNNPSSWDFEMIGQAIEGENVQKYIIADDAREFLKLKFSEVQLFKENGGNGVKNTTFENEGIILNFGREEYKKIRENISKEKIDLESRGIFAKEDDIIIGQYIIAEHYLYNFLLDMKGMFSGFKQEYIRLKKESL